MSVTPFTSIRVYRSVFLALVFNLISVDVHAHHGVAGLGAAELKGPGAPIDAATSAGLPTGKMLLYLKLDHANYETYDADSANPESKYANFWMSGIGYGFTPWFSAYLFVPYHDKVDEPGGFDTAGVADLSLFGQVSFKYDDGLQLLPAQESLDDLEDWHFTVFGGITLPTGDANLRDGSGNIDPGKSTGFGKVSWSLGTTATKMLSQRWTFNQEVSTIGFQEYQYDDGNRTQFGTEYRFNSALVYQAYTDTERRFRVDLALEAQYLHLGRDKTNSVNELATGGEIVYLLPGVRLYWDNFSAALGVKTPIWTDLNEEPEQQGGEGSEDYRLIFTLSTLF